MFRAAIVCLALAACARSADPASERETIVLVVVDTLRADALDCDGSGPTPNLCALAAEGVRFHQAIASSGWTLPSVASILSGTWPEIHKATGRKTILTPVSPDVPLAAELFAAAGWETAAVVNAAFLSPLLGLERGFGRFDHVHAFNRRVRRADATVDAALAWMESSAAPRRFVLVHLFDPHLDYDPPPPFAAGRALTLELCRAMGAQAVETVRRQYMGEVAFVDREIGRLVDGLQARGEWERTTFVVVSDHGEELWEHGGFEHGHTLYDELIRVPLIVKLPARAGVAPRAVAEQVRTIDVLPTLLELAGIEPPATCAGASLLALARGQSEAPRVAFSQGRLYGSDLLSWRTGELHYLHDRGAGVEPRAQLFDHSGDPREQEDLAVAHPETAARLERELAAFWSDLRRRGQAFATPAPEDMGPTRIRAYVESLESLGYTGRDEGE